MRTVITAALAGLLTLTACATHRRTLAEPPVAPAPPVYDPDSGGILMPEQAAYDVRFYDLSLTIDPDAHSIRGVLTVEARIVDALGTFVLDLDRRLTVDSVWVGEHADGLRPFERDARRVWIDLGHTYARGETAQVSVAYGGMPRVAPMPPWDGGFTWSTTESGAPWIGVSCQIDGADLWWPCKDHPSDEPDDGVALHYTVPDSLVVAANGRLERVDENGDGTRTFHWTVGEPINTYDVTFNAGPFRTFEAEIVSVTGETIPVTYWVIPEDTSKGEILFDEFLEQIRFLERIAGPYPFRAEKIGIVEAPYLAMEHQTVITYGRAFDDQEFGLYTIVLHELAHEWFGNLASAADWRDFWLHEAFADYMEALYVGDRLGPSAYREYLVRLSRPAVRSRHPVAPRDPRTIRQMLYPDGFDRSLPGAVLRQMDGDVAAKGAWILHTLRYLVGDDAFFTLVRRVTYPDPSLEATTDGSQCHFVSTEGFIALAEEISGRDLDWFFEVYVRQPVLPRLIIDVHGSTLEMNWEVPDGFYFPMPVEIVLDGEHRRIAMIGGRASMPWNDGNPPVVDPDAWVLRQTVPSPDAFGTLGVRAPR